MKRVLALVLSFLLTMPVALADTASSSRLQEVLLKVKEKIEIPSELTEFESNLSDYKKITTYNFDWHDKKYEKSISVSADEDGRILNYYNNTSNLSNKKLTNISKSEIISFADEFLKKTLPDMYQDPTDKLVFDEKSYSAGNGSLRYSFSYYRQKNCVKVKRNSVNVSVCVDDEEKLFVRSMSASIDYDAAFLKKGNEISNLTEKYKATFPMELVYKNEYNPQWKAKGESRMLPVLIYRNKDNIAGYICAETGERVEEDTDNNNLFRDESAEDSFGSMNKNESFTEKELAEITAVGGLLSREEIENKIKKLSYISFPEDLSLESSYLFKNDEGNYIYSFHYADKDSEKYRYLSLSVYAKDAKLINYHYSGDGKYRNDVTLNENQKKSAEKKIEEFLKTAAGEEFENSKLETSDENNGYINSYYYRVVNSVKHIDNGINICFDGVNAVITSFSLNFTGTDFKDASLAIGEESAYEKLLSYAPIERLYVKSGGSYKVCASLSKSGVTLDALTGEITNRNEEENLSFSYSDISGHWAEEAATKLAEIQVGFEGEILNPDNTVTQEELLRFIASGIYGKYYHTSTTEDLYESLIREKVITKEEKAPSSFVKREDAFVFMIRMIGLEKVAKLENIYKVDFKDSSILTEGKIGYCAILSGFGVICGDGGYLRPNDGLTRAEAIVMLYRYLLTE